MIRSGRAYHIALAAGEVPRRIVLVGDPARVDLASGLLGDFRIVAQNREFRSGVGLMRDREVMVLSTGIGPDNVEIVVHELTMLKGPGLLLARAGTSGGVNAELGELVISTAAVRLENTTDFYAPKGFPAVADPEIALRMAEVAKRLGFRHRLGITATAPGFFAPQGREVLLRPWRWSLGDVARLGVANMEMEMSVLFVLSSLLGHRAGGVCAVIADRKGKRALDPREKREAERAALRVALETLASI